MAASKREESFAMIDGALERSVAPLATLGRPGRPYVHRCSKQVYEAVAHAADEAGDEGFTLTELVEREQVPNSQAAVALAFLKERGCVETRRRRNYAASGDVFIDAMIEWHALAEGGEA